MKSYSAWKEGDSLSYITKITPLMTATDTDGEYFINEKGDWFWFAENSTEALYKSVRQINGGTIVKRNDDLQIMKAFSEAIALDLTEVTIYPISQAAESPVTPETQEQVKSMVAEKIVLQPIVQPIQTQGETVIPQFQTFTAEPQFEEIATYAETWTWQNIALPVIAKGVKVYNDNVPENEVRPREYVVMSVDDELSDTDFADDTNQTEESFVMLIVQGFGTKFDNWVDEVSQYIHGLLRGFRTNGKVNRITNREIGFDETLKIYSRTVSFWLRYKS